MDIQEAFLRDILANPGDPAPRLVYADWLDEQGDPRSAARAEFLRVEWSLARLAGGDEHRSQGEARLQELRSAVGPRWVAALARSKIENCRIWFKVRCPKRWEKLTPTADAEVRFCETCRKGVHYCHTIEEAREHAWGGHCVAVDLGVRRAKGDLQAEPEGMWLGEVDLGPDDLEQSRG